MSDRQDAYTELLGRLYRARRFGMRLGLERIDSCLAALGRPQDDFRARVQIAGTNGKGSTAAFVESMLRSAGVRTGLFTSPHLSCLSERFLVNGEPLAESAIAEAGAAVARAADQAADQAEGLTFFEQVTAMAAWAFSRAEVDIAVMEVGLGGRFDATTALGAEVTAVTGVALDHQRILGDTISAIAGEKAGIFRSGQRAVVGASGEPEAVELLVGMAEHAGVAGVSVVSSPSSLVPEDCALGLGGAHQHANAACAVAVVDELEALGLVRVGRAQRRQALADTCLPGRMEVVELPAGCRAILDGAHNPHAARALGRALQRVERGQTLAVLGVSSGKDVRGIVEALVTDADLVIATGSRQDRAMDPEEVARAVRAVRAELEVLVEPNTAAAVERACSLAKPGDLVLVAGSLFVVGEARETICGIEPDPVPLSDPLPRCDTA